MSVGFRWANQNPNRMIVGRVETSGADEERSSVPLSFFPVAAHLCCFSVLEIPLTEQLSQPAILKGFSSFTFTGAFHISSIAACRVGCLRSARLMGISLR